MPDGDAIVRLATTLVADIGNIVESVLPTVRAEIGDAPAGRAIADEDFRESITAVVREFLLVLQQEPAVSPRAIDAVVRRRFAQGLALVHLLHGYRVCAAAVWERLALLVRGVPGESEALLLATPRFFEMVDDFSLRAHRIYRELAIRNVQRQEQIRATLLDTLFYSESEQGASFWNAVTTLGIPRQGQFLVVDVGSATESTQATDWEELACEVDVVETARFRLGLQSQVGLICLAAPTSGYDLGRHLADRAAVTVGLSRPFASLAHCRRARVQAGVAAAATSPTQMVKRYGHDVLDVLMASSPDAADSLVTATLGGILALPSAQAKPLIDTVRQWLANGQSISATASVMHCHRNTVNNRLRRFEELSGQSLTDNVWLAQVILAVNSTSAVRPETTKPR